VITGNPKVPQTLADVTITIGVTSITDNGNPYATSLQFKLDVEMEHVDEFESLWGLPGVIHVAHAEWKPFTGLESMTGKEIA